MTKLLIVAATMAVVAAGAALAADAPDCKSDGMSMMMDMTPKGDAGPASMAYAHANMMMHSAMNITYTGNSDIDFVKGMMPHHQGAIDMAKIVLKSGKDLEIRKLAQGIITAQEGEIAQMQAWLAAHPQ